MPLPVLNLALAVAVIALQMADLWTTWVILVAGGGTEKNPVLRWLMARIGPGPALVGAKIAAGSVVVWLYVHHYGSVWLFAGLAVLAAFYVWVVLHNLEQMRLRPDA